MRAWSAVTICLFATTALPGEPRWTLDLNLRGKHVEGAPLIWSERQVELLGRDGRLWSFSPGEASQFRKASNTFHSFTAAEMRGQLAGELGHAFEISGTGHYLVAHAPGQRDYWSKRFEDLYRSFMHYFHVRGFELHEPAFPLVAIVFRNQDDFLRYAHAEGAQIGANVLGYYSPVSNRVSLFDVSGGDANARDWHENAATIIHEATHQTAFNTGLHSRFGQMPRWLVEGLGTMFEAQGVWDSTHHSTRVARYNLGRLQEFRRLASQRPKDSLAEFLSGDELFQTHVDRAYAEAWALSFYLVETRPKKYAELLTRTASRPDFQPYEARQRVADFTAIFGNDLRLLEAQFLRFMAELE